MRPKGLTDAVDLGIANGGATVCAARESGQLVCWGQVAGLGADDPSWEGVRHTDVSEPAAVIGLDRARFVHGGDGICVEHVDRRISCSGSAAGFVEVPELRGTTDLFAGRDTWCGVAEDATLRCVDREDGTVSTHYENVVRFRGWIERDDGDYYCVVFTDDPPMCGQTRCLVSICSDRGAFERAAFAEASDMAPIGWDYCGLFGDELRCLHVNDSLPSSGTIDAAATGIAEIAVLEASHEMACMVDATDHVLCSGSGPDWTAENDRRFRHVPETYVPWRHRLAWLAAFGLLVVLGLWKVRTVKREPDAAAPAPAQPHPGNGWPTGRVVT